MDMSERIWVAFSSVKKRILVSTVLLFLFSLFFVQKHIVTYTVKLNFTPGYFVVMGRMVSLLEPELVLVLSDINKAMDLTYGSAKLKVFRGLKIGEFFFLASTDISMEDIKKESNKLHKLLLESLRKSSQVLLSDLSQMNLASKKLVTSEVELYLKDASTGSSNKALVSFLKDDLNKMNLDALRIKDLKNRLELLFPENYFEVKLSEPTPNRNLNYLKLSTIFFIILILTTGVLTFVSLSKLKK